METKSQKIASLFVEDSQAKNAGLLKLLLAFQPIDIKKAIAASNATDNVTTDEFYASYPAMTAIPLADDLSVVFVSDNIGDFVINSINAILSLAKAISHFGQYTSPKQLEELINSWEAYNSAPAGSVGEIQARQQFEGILEDINETVLRRSPKMYAAFVDPELGFAITSQEALSGTYDDDAEEDEEEDEDEEAEDTDSEENEDGSVSFPEVISKKGLN